MSLTHLDKDGKAQMVDVTEKSDTARVAIASCTVKMHPNTYATVMNTDNPKGDVFATARIAGIQAAKKCSELIPLCHPLMLSSVNIDIQSNKAKSSLTILCTCKITGKTGVEMEALTGASVAALTIYDMCKAIDKSIVMTDTKLLQKSGGKSGSWKRKED